MFVLTKALIFLFSQYLGKRPGRGIITRKCERFYRNRVGLFQYQRLSCLFSGSLLWYATLSMYLPMIYIYIQNLLLNPSHKQS